MTRPNSTYLAAAGHELHITEWGDPDKPLLVMWHGLARTGRDFDEAAKALRDSYFVVCPDTIGRGLSTWAKDPITGYTFGIYGELALAMLDHYGADKLRWVGTSMGGLLGITLAATALKDRITHLVINDVGPDIPADGSRRIADYVGNPPTFDTMSEMEHWLRTTYASFGSNTDYFWRRMAETSTRRKGDGRLTVHYDPGIVSLMKENSADLDVWDVYKAVTARAILFRGEKSDVLTAETAQRMTEVGPKPELITRPDCGHAPTLASAEEIALVRAFLQS